MYDDRPGRIRGRIVRAGRDERRAERRIGMAVAHVQRQVREPGRCAKLDPFASRLADVLKVTGVDRPLAAGDELDIVIKIGAIHRRGPRRAAAGTAARAGLDSSRHDLPQRRIA